MSHIEDLALEIDYLRGDLTKRDAEIETLRADNERLREAITEATEAMHDGSDLTAWAILVAALAPEDKAMTIDDVLKQMRERAINALVDEPFPSSELMLWASVIEAAMTEPVAYLMENKEYPHLAKSLHFSPPEWHITWTPRPLFAFPPSAQAEIERLNRLAALASAYIKDLEEHEGAEGFSASTWELSAQYYAALAGKEEKT